MLTEPARVLLVAFLPLLLKSPGQCFRILLQLTESLALSLHIERQLRHHLIGSCRPVHLIDVAGLLTVLPDVAVRLPLNVLSRDPGVVVSPVQVGLLTGRDIINLAEHLLIERSVPPIRLAIQVPTCLPLWKPTLASRTCVDVCLLVKEIPRPSGQSSFRVARPIRRLVLVATEKVRHDLGLSLPADVSHPSTSACLPYMYSSAYLHRLDCCTCM